MSLQDDIYKISIDALKNKPEIESDLFSWVISLVPKYAEDHLKNKPKVESQLNRIIAAIDERITLCTKLVKQAIRYRRILFYFLLGLMSVETILLVLFVYFVPRLPESQRISDTGLQIIAGATIIQISAMIIVIVKSVFPKDLRSLIDISKEISTIQRL